MVGRELDDLFRRHSTRAVDLDIGHLLDLAETPVADPRPSRKTGKTTFACHTTAQVVPGFRESYPVTPLPRGPSRLEAGGTRADNQDMRFAQCRKKHLRVPVLAPLLAKGWVLRAAP